MVVVTAEPRRHPFPEPAPRPPTGYLDAVAGQPLLPAARQAWLAAAELAWSDPARLHHEGRRAGMVLDAARASVAGYLGVRPEEVFFTSSGPTAAAVAVQGLLDARGGAPARVVIGAVESLAVTSPVGRWSSEADVIPVDSTGRIDPAAFESALAHPAALACLQAANGEVGTRQPVGPVLGAARRAGVPLLVHAVQVVGRGPVPSDWDVLAASARDWGGPAGVGVLAVRTSVRWTPDENPDRGWVGGFPDVPGAAAAATALEYVAPWVEQEARRAHDLTAVIRAQLPEIVPGVTVAGSPDDRLPHIVTFTVPGVTGEVLVTELGRVGLSVASGSACTADTRMPSQVLAAIGLAADASVRVSLPYACTEATVEAFLDALPGAVESARSGSR